MSSKGKRLRSGQKAIIMNVHEYFVSEKAAQKKKLLREQQRPASNIYKKFSECGESFSTPSKQYKVNRSDIEDINDTGAIRRAIHALFGAC